MRTANIPRQSIQRSALAFRLLIAGLMLLASLSAGQLPRAELIICLAVYVGFALALSTTAERLPSTFTVYPVALFDVITITIAIALSPAMPIPLWTVYLLAIASATVAGRAQTLATGTAAIGAYLLTCLLAGRGLSTVDLWVLALMSSTTTITGISASKWRAEQCQKRSLQELAAAIIELDSGGGFAEISHRVVEIARRLTRAQHASLWFPEESSLSSGPQAGHALSEQQLEILSSCSVPPNERGCLELAYLGEPFRGSRGKIVPLRYQNSLQGLLILSCRRDPDVYSRMESLLVFARASAQALAAAKSRDTAGEAFRCEQALRKAATALAGARDRQTACGVVRDAMSRELRANVSFVPPISNLRATSSKDIAEVETGGELPESSVIVPLADGLVMAVSRGAEPFDDGEQDFLEHLAATAAPALKRALEYERLRYAASLLRASFEALPAPVTIRSRTGTTLTNSAHGSLAIAGEAMAKAELAEEVVVGEPPRVFAIDRAMVADGEHEIVLLREITREREALPAKDDLIATVGHELRSPLSSIFGYSQLMARQIGVVQQQVGRLNGLIGDFLEASRHDGNRLPLDRQSVALDDLAHKAAERFQGAFPGRDLELEVADVPAIEGDPERLCQVIDNLLANAAKYSPEDKEIVLSVYTAGGDVTLSVEDYGVGIANEDLDRIFRRFYRAPNTKEVKGLGLGLSIVRDLVAAHEGKVWAESAGPGQGSTFFASFPISARRAALAPREGAA